MFREFWVSSKGLQGLGFKVERFCGLGLRVSYLERLGFGVKILRLQGTVFGDLRFKGLGVRVGFGISVFVLVFCMSQAETGGFLKQGVEVSDNRV